MTSSEIIKNGVLQPIGRHSLDIISNRGCSGAKDRRLKKQESIAPQEFKGKVPSGRTLIHQQSKLDLIDDTTLTSLPLPPPMKAKSKSAAKCHELLSDTDGISLQDSSYIDSTFRDESFNYENDSFCNDEPIVLIEDYLEDKKFDHDSTMIKKMSLANFKQKTLQSTENILDSLDSLRKKDTCMNTSLSLRNVNEIYMNKEKECLDRDINPSLSYFKSENLEEIFGKIPGSDQLKHCELCEKPLYEISSILNNSNRGKQQKLSSKCLSNRREPIVTNNNNVNELYTEFICGECIEAYEEFSNELCSNKLHTINDDDETRNEDSLSINTFNDETRARLIHIFHDVQHKYQSQCQNSINEVTTNECSFSDNLISELKVLNDHQMNSRDQGISDKEWIRAIQHKLRWRWRLAGLLPGSLTYGNKRIE